MASQITSASIVCPTVGFLGNSPVTGEFPTQMAIARKILPFDDVIMSHLLYGTLHEDHHKLY